MNTSIVLFTDNAGIIVNESNFINLERELNTVGARGLHFGTVVVFYLYKLLTFDNSVFKPHEHFNCIIC
jgi:hypothetical protein